MKISTECTYTFNTFKKRWPFSPACRQQEQTSRGDRGRLMLQSVWWVSGDRSGLSKLQILTPQIERPLCTVTSSHTVNPKADNSQSILSPAVSWEWNRASFSLALENESDNCVFKVQHHLLVKGIGRSPYYYCFHCLIILAHMPMRKVI